MEVFLDRQGPEGDRVRSQTMRRHLNTTQGDLNERSLCRDVFRWNASWKKVHSDKTSFSSPKQDSETFQHEMQYLRLVLLSIILWELHAYRRYQCVFCSTSLPPASTRWFFRHYYATSKQQRCWYVSRPRPRIEPWAAGWEARTLSIVLCGPLTGDTNVKALV